MIGKRLRFETSHPTEFVDITDRLRDEVRRAGLKAGRVHLQSLHTTVGIAINENEPLLIREFASLLGRLAPVGGGEQAQPVELHRQHLALKGQRVGRYPIHEAPQRRRQQRYATYIELLQRGRTVNWLRVREAELWGLGAQRP